VGYPPTSRKDFNFVITNTRLQFFGNHWRFLDNRSGAAICVKEYAHPRCHRGRPQKKSTDCARMFRRSSSAVATSREGHRSQRSGRRRCSDAQLASDIRAPYGRSATALVRLPAYLLHFRYRNPEKRNPLLQVFWYKVLIRVLGGSRSGAERRN
jgi:hypothetical protein